MSDSKLTADDVRKKMLAQGFKLRPTKKVTQSIGATDKVVTKSATTNASSSSSSSSNFHNKPMKSFQEIMAEKKRKEQAALKLEQSADSTRKQQLHQHHQRVQDLKQQEISKIGADTAAQEKANELARAEKLERLKRANAEKMARARAEEVSKIEAKNAIQENTNELTRAEKLDRLKQANTDKVSKARTEELIVRQDHQEDTNTANIIEARAGQEKSNDLAIAEKLERLKRVSTEKLAKARTKEVTCLQENQAAAQKNDKSKEPNTLNQPKSEDTADRTEVVAVNVVMSDAEAKNETQVEKTKETPETDKSILTSVPLKCKNKISSTIDMQEKQEPITIPPPAAAVVATGVGIRKRLISRGGLNRVMSARGQTVASTSTPTPASLSTITTTKTSVNQANVGTTEQNTQRPQPNLTPKSRVTIIERDSAIERQETQVTLATQQKLAQKSVVSSALPQLTTTISEVEKTKRATLSSTATPSVDVSSSSTNAMNAPVRKRFRRIADSTTPTASATKLSKSLTSNDGLESLLLHTMALADTSHTALIAVLDKDCDQTQLNINASNPSRPFNIDVLLRDMKSYLDEQCQLTFA